MKCAGTSEVKIPLWKVPLWLRKHAGDACVTTVRRRPQKKERILRKIKKGVLSLKCCILKQCNASKGPFTRCDFFQVRQHFLVKPQPYSMNSNIDIHRIHSLRYEKTQSHSEKIAPCEWALNHECMQNRIEMVSDALTSIIKSCSQLGCI